MKHVHGPLSKKQINLIDSYWRASNYVSVGQIYLRDNPLLRRPLELKDVKQLLLGHWGTTPGQNFIYTHLNRVIKKFGANMIYISGPGHGGPAIMSQVYLEGTFSEIRTDFSLDEAGMKQLFKKSSFPGGLSSHVSPQVPGSIHEGGELGYSLSHAYGAAFDNPDLIVSCVIGDGEAETGPLAAAWHSNKFLNPVSDGAVLPILHLNGYKISNPTILARIDRKELGSLLKGYGYSPRYVEGHDPKKMHQDMARELDAAMREIRAIQKNARENNDTTRPKWPVVVLISPKGWTGPKIIAGKNIEGTYRSHQVPLPVDKNHLENLKRLEEWLLSYKPHELFDQNGTLLPHLADLAPKNSKRMGANPHANGGLVRLELDLPDFRDYGVDVPKRSDIGEGDAHVLGRYLRDVIKENDNHKNFRIFGPDELVSNRLEQVFEVTNRQWMGQATSADDNLAPHGAVLDSILSEHTVEGWLEGYLLTGRHGLLNSYEAFIRIIDSMVSQHAKWIKMCSELPWRRDISSLNFLLTSHVWRQDHNGFTHQDPGFIDHIINKKPKSVRVYLPPDANCLLSVVDHCLNSRNYINVVVSGKHPSPQWLSMEEAVVHCNRGASVWDWASNDDGEPDVVMACAGDVPTLETLAAVSILRSNLPKLKIRVVNVVDLMRLQPEAEHPHGMNDIDYNELFTTDKKIIFAYHGYPWLIHRLVYRRKNQNMHVRGYKEEGAITTAFDMTVLNNLDRFHLVLDVIYRLDLQTKDAVALKEEMEKKLVEHRNYVNENGIDMPEIRNWSWNTNEN